MAVQFPCLVCNRTVAENHRTVQCNLCDSWVHIACNNLNLYTYQKLQKDKSPRHCMCCFWKELPYGSINETKLRGLLHGEAVVSPNPKIISNRIKQSKCFDEETLKKENNRFYTPDEFNTALKSFSLASQLSITYPLYLINTLSCIIYFQILKLNQIYMEYLKLGFKGVSNQ